jgi:hypothetical protein
MLWDGMVMPLAGRYLGSSTVRPLRQRGMNKSAQGGTL